MKTDFCKPALIFALAAVLTGLLAWVLPGYSNDLFPIRKMPWFSALSKPPAPDSTSVAPQVVRQPQIALKPFLDQLKAMPVLPGQTPLSPASQDTAFSPLPRQLRIAYFSDSIIEGDLITAPLRSALQQRYGGHGVGMMPITSIVAGFRQTVRHSFSKNWESISFMAPNQPAISLGITGYTFIPRPYYLDQKPVEMLSADSLFFADSLQAMSPDPEDEDLDDDSFRHYVDEDPWVEYRAVDIAGGADSFRRIRLFYSHASDSSLVRVSHDSKPQQELSLRSGKDLKILDISPQSPSKRLRLEFDRDDPIRLYGVSFDDHEGIYVDNFPIRGYSGMCFQRIHKHFLTAFDQALDYDLIVLQYGGNITDPDNEDYSYYKTAMIRTLEHIQTAMPDVPILIASMHDRAVKAGTGFRTSPDIPLLVQTQSEIAQETDCAFWNVYEAMGGQNSMLGFVNQNPPLAGTDYTHFTRRGAERIATLFLDFLKEEM
jgi:lysophospholipase L1-like esterase